MGNKKEISKFSKKNKLLITILISSIAVVFAFLGILLYINYYERVHVVLTTITRYKNGSIKNVTEYDDIFIKKGRNVTNFSFPTAEGYSFGGWFYDKDCKEPYDYEAILNENIQVYGRMDLLEYEIELILDEGIKIKNNISQNYNYGSKFTIEDVIKLPRLNDKVTMDDDSQMYISEYKTMYKEGYTFEGWAFSSTAETNFNFDYKMTAQNLTFYALWKPIKVSLKYCTLDLNFAKDYPQSGFVGEKINQLNGGLMYSTYYNIYIDETISYGTKVREVVPPSDKNKNFEFAGWYLDTDFTIPVKFGQLYIRNGYFSLTRENNKNILEDPLYFGGSVPTQDVVDAIMANNSTNENDSYIKLFAKWTLKKYTVKFHLNLPSTDSYVDTENMRSIVKQDIDRFISYDNGNSIIQNENVYQGKNILPNYFVDGVLYDANYFKNVVYIKDDMTGLPLYTLYGWNSKRDGSGYDAQNTSDVYFDKSNFDITNDNEIVIYAQWQSYHRINYYLTNRSTQILLSTTNVESNKISVPTLKSLVVGIEDRLVTFTEFQKQMNADVFNFSKNYYTPINESFAGWSDDSNYTLNENKLYIEGVEYNVGNHVKDGEGISLNNQAVIDLYTAWVGNVNSYQYNLGENMDQIDFSKDPSLKDLFIENGDYKIHKYDRTSIKYTVKTIDENDEFLISKTAGGVRYSLDGWKLKDNSRIKGNEELRIQFNSNNIEFVNCSEVVDSEYSEIETGIYLTGNYSISCDDYYTYYDDLENKSFIVLKARNKTLLKIEGYWIKNVTLTYSAGVDDVVWEDGFSASDLTNIVGGNVKMTVSDPQGKMTRPYYEFYGWSVLNREAEGSVVDFNKFIDDNLIYIPGRDKTYELLTEDTTLYAVWKPLVYSVTIFKQAYNSPNNASSGRIYIAKEAFVDNRTIVTSEIVFSGSVLTYYDVAGNQINMSMTTSAESGYGLSDWSDSEGNPLVKNSGVYKISCTSGEGVNNLFNGFPSESDENINIYPVFSILRFDVTFLLYGEGLSNSVVTSSTFTKNGIEYASSIQTYLGGEVSIQIGSQTITVKDVPYGTEISKIVPDVYYTYYSDGYSFKGWNISGDVDNRGNLKEDYITKLDGSKIGVRSDLRLTLAAEKGVYMISLMFDSPAGETQDIRNYSLYYNDSLDLIVDQMREDLAKYSYVGYNFSHWQLVIGGNTMDVTEDDLSYISVTSTIELHTKYKKAKVKVIYNYEVDGEEKTHVVESEYLSQFSLDTSRFDAQPSKTNYKLKGWSLNDVDQESFFDLGSSFKISSTVVGDKLIRVDDYYELNLYAKWVESIALSFDLSEVNLTFAGFPTILYYEQNEIVMFKNIPYISSLTNSTIKQNNGLGEYNGVWVDQNGKEYSVNLTSSYIKMSESMTIKPKFTPRTYTITYNYLYLGEYYSINEASVVVSESDAAPVLLNEAEINAFISSKISSNRAVGYYLSRNAFINNDANFKFDFGETFDFVNNPSYLGKVSDSKFEFYVILQKTTSLTYYNDRNESTAFLTLQFDQGLSYLVGDTNNDGEVNASDTIPTKKGFVFGGWSSSIDRTFVDYNNGDLITTGVTTKLFPYWTAEEVKIEYLHDTTLLAYVGELTFDDSVTLRSSFTQPGKTLKGWAKTNGGAVEFNPGSTFTIEENSDIAVLESGVFVIRLYAVWETAMYSVKFEVYSADGSKQIRYGNLSGDIVNTEFTHEYESSTMLTYTMPTTAETYVDGRGQTYRFTGQWKDEDNNTYTTSVGGVRFIKNYVFTPIYQKIFTLTFSDGTNEIYKLENVVENTVFTFNHMGLASATTTYNATIYSSGKKVVGYSYNGVDYSGTASITITSNMQFTAKLVSLVTVVVYKNVNYNEGFTFANSTTLSDVEKSTTISLDSFATTMTGCAIRGFVVSGDANYEYSPSATNLKTGNFDLSTFAGNTVYFYPVIQTTVTYYVNGVEKDTETAILGTKPTKLNMNSADGTYLTSWRIGSESGAVFDTQNGIVVDKLDLYAMAKPFLQLKVEQGFRNYFRTPDMLLIDGVTPYEEITLPNQTKAVLKDNSTYTISGWYISHNGSMAMDGANRKVYSLGEETTVETIISDIGKTLEEIEITSISFDMIPILVHKTVKLHLNESANITYNFNVQLYNVSGLDVETIENKLLEKSTNYTFYLLPKSALDVNSTTDTISFNAYLVDEGAVVYNNYNPVYSLITVSKTVSSGYVSTGWYYANKNELVLDGTQITADTTIKAQTAEAEDIQMSIGLKYYDESEYNIIDSSSIDSYDEHFYIVSGSKYAQTIDDKYGNIINFKVVINNGYEFMKLVDANNVQITANVSLSGNEYTFTHQIGSATQIYVVVKKSTEFSPIIEINSSLISGYDASKIDNSSVMYLRVNSGGVWSYLYKDSLQTDYNVTWSELTSGYMYNTKVGVNTDIQIFTNIVSNYYYVKTINLYNDGVLGSNSLDSNSITTGVTVTGVPKIEIVLAERTYQINYYDSSNSLIEGTSKKVQSAVTVDLPELTKTGYSLNGFSVKIGSELSDITYFEYISSDKTYSISNLVRYNSGRNINNQNIYVVLTPVWFNNQYKLKLNIDDTKGYFSVNSQNRGSSVEISIPYGQQLKYENDILSFNQIAYSVNNGELKETVTATQVAVVPLGTWQFDGYTKNSSPFAETTVTVSEDISLLAKTKAGNGNISVSIVDNTASVDNKLLEIGKVKFNSTEKTLGYGVNGQFEEITAYTFSSQDSVVVDIVPNAGFTVSSIDIICDGVRLSADSNIASKIGLTINGNKLTFTNLCYSVEIEYTLARNSFEASIQVVSASSGSDLESIYSQLSSEGKLIAMVGSQHINVGSFSTISTQKLRVEKEYTFLFNSDYFDLDSIYYVDNGNTYNIYGGVVDESLSSFNPATNKLSIVYGGASGSDIEIYIVLRLKNFSVVFHNINSEYPSNADYSQYDESLITPDETTSYEYGSHVQLESSQIFAPADVSFNSMNFRFVGWKYYNGNYENDIKDDSYDASKLVDLDSLDWTYSASNGRLHLFSKWEKLFDVNFIESNDGFSATQSNLPSSISDAGQGETLILEVPSRTGFGFAGFTYVYEGENYILPYDGEKFTALELNSVVVNTVGAFNTDEIKVNQLITAEMLSMDVLFNQINFEPIWTRNSLTLTIDNNTEKGQYKFYKYNGTTYEESNFTIMYYSKVEADTITIDETEYNAVIVKDGSNIVGAIVVIPNKAKYYKFSKFKLDGEDLNSLKTLNGGNTLKIEYAEDYVPHTLNLTWDKPVGQISYTLQNLSTNPIKLECHNTTFERMETVAAGSSVTLTSTYSKIIVSMIRDQAIHVKLVLDEYNYNLNSEIELSLSNTQNVLATSSNYVLHLNTSDIDISQYLIDNPSITGGDYQVSYYAPIMEGGVITGYSSTLTTHTVHNQLEWSIHDIVTGTKLYFTNTSNVYEIVQVLNGTVDVSNSDSGANNIYVVVPKSSGTYDLKLIFDSEYSLVTFKINEVDYASAYFTTTNGTSVNTQLSAFANMLVYGFNNLSNTQLSAMFNQPSLLDDGDYSTVSTVIKARQITKENGVVNDYYTEAELRNMFAYEINENLAKIYHSETRFDNVWFESFDFETAYQGIVDINSLYIGAGVEEVVFSSNISKALVVSIDAINETVENKVGENTYSTAYANGGIVIQNSGSYFVMGNSEEDGYNGSYSRLVLKVKNNTALPKIIANYDENTYTSAITISEKIVSDSDTRTDKVLIETGKLNYTVEFNVKMVKLRVNSTDRNDDTNFSFEQDFTDMNNPNYRILEANYAATFDWILASYGLENSYVREEKTYKVAGFYTGALRIDQDGEFNNYDDLGSYYFETINTTYTQGSELVLEIRYQVQN